MCFHFHDEKEFPPHSGSWWFSNCQRDPFPMNHSQTIPLKMQFFVMLRQLIEGVTDSSYFPYLLRETACCHPALFSTQTHPKVPFPQRTWSSSRWTSHYHPGNSKELSKSKSFLPTFLFDFISCQKIFCWTLFLFTFCGTISGSWCLSLGVRGLWEFFGGLSSFGFGQKWGLVTFSLLKICLEGLRCDFRWVYCSIMKECRQCLMTTPYAQAAFTCFTSNCSTNHRFRY